MSSTPPPSPLSPGFRLDRYELLCPIAEGGMASVWIARQTGRHGFQKFVAVKTILPKYASDTRFQRMFYDEARIVSRIEHLNVAQILDVGEQHDVTYLVMEYVDGDALSRLYRALEKKGSKIPLGVILRIMADVCAGLHAAHELRDNAGQPLGVVHRDVSPQNVLVSTTGVAKLIDFGIAKARDRLANDTRSNQLKGKIAYMAPEQALGGTIDRRADVWAVGAVLYHLLSGQPPFDGDNDVQRLFVLASGKPPAPLPSTVPAPVTAIVSRALSHGAQGRFATAVEMQQALERAMAEIGATTTTTAVAAFLREHASDRAQKRKEAIAIGLKAAEERERVSAVMKAHTETAGPSSSSMPENDTAVSTVAEAGEKSAPGTLGLATVTLALPGRPRSVKVAVLGAAVGLAIGVAGMLLMRGGGGATKRAAATTSAMTSVAEPAAGQSSGRGPETATSEAVDPSAAPALPSAVASTAAVPTTSAPERPATHAPPTRRHPVTRTPSVPARQSDGF